MERHEEIDRLKTRLQWESGAPLAHLPGEATDAFAARAKALGADSGALRRSRRFMSVMSNCNTCARRKGLLQMNTKQDINRLIETLECFRDSRLTACAAIPFLRAHVLQLDITDIGIGRGLGPG